MRRLLCKLTWIALWNVNVISTDSNSGIQCKFSSTIYRAKGLSTTKAFCNANLVYDHEAHTFKHPEPDLEALIDGANDNFCATLNAMITKLLLFLGPTGEEP